MESEKDGADLLYGVPAIARFVGLSTAAVYHLTNRDDFPAFKIGGKVCSRRSSIGAWLAEQEAKGKTTCP